MPSTRSPLCCAACIICLAELGHTWLCRSVSMVIYNTSSSSLYNCNSESVSIVIIHGQGERDQSGVAGDAFVIRYDASHPIVCWFFEGFAATYAIVRNDDAAGPGQAQRPLEVLWIGRFVSVNKDEIEWSFVLQLWEQLKRSADTHFGTVADACLHEGILHQHSMSGIDFQRYEAAIGG